MSSLLLRHPFWFYFTKHKRLVLLGALWLFLTNMFETFVPFLVGRTIDSITLDAPLSDVGRIIGTIFLVIVGVSIFRFLWRLFWATFHHAAAEDLRNRVFEKMSDLGPSFFRPRKIGQLISLITNDVNSFRMGVGPGVLILFDGISLVCLTVPFMIAISPSWTWQTLILMPFVPFVVRLLLGKYHSAYHGRQTRFADMAGSAQEIVSGVRVIKSFAQEKNQTTLFNVQSRGFTTACDKVSFWDAALGPALELPVALGSVLLLLLGVGPVIAGQVSLGQFVAFYQYIQRMIWPMSAIGIGIGHIQEGRAAFQRIREVLELQPDVPDAGDLVIENLESIEARNLFFTYPGKSEPVLKNISFCLNKGECLGIVGRTGSGKSTLIELLARQYPVASGTLLINGVSIERYKLAPLRRLIGFVPQDAFLFSRKVSENLALGLEHWQPEDVREAAAQVRLDQEIDTWPGTYDALIGERGVNLSGGQKQRMTLARALIRDAQLVILDDALSAVDAKTEASILSSLRGELGKTTSIVVSHRLASVRFADRILVLNQGEVETAGRHEDLIRDSRTYRALHEMQMGAET